MSVFRWVRAFECTKALTGAVGRSCCRSPVEPTAVTTRTSDRISATVRVIAAVLCAVALVTPIRAGATPEPRASSTATQPVTVESMEDDLAWLINLRREKAGMAPLKVIDAIRPVARDWSKAMAAAGKISHHSDLSVYPNAVAGNYWHLAGENVGVTDSEKRGGVHVLTVLDQAFWDSKPHRENVLGPFNSLSIGAFDDGERLWVSVAFVDFDPPLDGRLPTSSLHDSQGALVSAAASGRAVTAIGWADDPDSTPVAVHITVDGTPAASTQAFRSASAPPALNPIPDPTGWGYRQTLQLAPGTHTVCGQAENTVWGVSEQPSCRTVAIQDEVLMARGDAATVVGRLDGTGAEPSLGSLLVDPRQRSWWATGVARLGVVPVFRLSVDDGAVTAAVVATVSITTGTVTSAPGTPQHLSLPSGIDTDRVRPYLVPTTEQSGALVYDRTEGWTNVGPSTAMTAMLAAAGLVDDPHVINGGGRMWLLARRQGSGNLVVVDDSSRVTELDFAPAAKADIAGAVGAFSEHAVGHREAPDLLVTITGRHTGRATGVRFSGTRWREPSGYFNPPLAGRSPLQLAPLFSP